MTKGLPKGLTRTKVVKDGDTVKAHQFRDNSLIEVVADGDAHMEEGVLYVNTKRWYLVWTGRYWEDGGF